MIHLHHAISLAIVYTNRATSGFSSVVTLEQAHDYQDAINHNLKEMKSKVRDLTPADYEVNPDELFFHYAADINNKGYYVLKNDHESLLKCKKYIMTMPLDIVLASQENNALAILGLEKNNEKIIKKEITKIKKIAK